MKVEADLIKARSQEGGVDLVTFGLGQQKYALPIEPIRQIIEMITITPVPQVQEFIEGVINFHGMPVPVVNLRHQLSLPRMQLQLHTPIILVTIANRLIGLIVDEVLDVINLSASQIVPPESVMPVEVGDIPVVHGLIQLEGETILYLDTNHLFAPREVRQISAATEAFAKDSADKIEQKPGSNGKRATKGARAIVSERNSDQNEELGQA